MKHVLAFAIKQSVKHDFPSDFRFYSHSVFVTRITSRYKHQFRKTATVKEEKTCGLLNETKLFNFFSLDHYCCYGALLKQSISFLPYYYQVVYLHAFIWMCYFD